MEMPVDRLKIKQLREKLGLSMEEAAQRAEMGGKQNWYGVESGTRDNVTIETLERMARVLGVKAKALLK